MINLKHIETNGKLLIVVLCFAVIDFCCIKSFGQSDSCLVKQNSKNAIEILIKNKTNTAHLNIDICYTPLKIVNVNIVPSFIKDETQLSEKKIKRQGHQLYLKKLDYTLDSLFSMMNATTPVGEITGPLSVSLMPGQEAYWINNSIDFTFTFIYIIENSYKKEKTFELTLLLPDNPIDSTLLKIEPDEPDVKPGESKVLKKGKDNLQGSGTVNTCLDSVVYYYQQLAKLYEKICGNVSINANVKELMREQFKHCISRFQMSIDSCDSPHRFEYKNSYNLFEKHLKTGLGISTESISENENAETETNEAETKNLRYKIILYVFSLLIMIAIAVFVYSKKMKKRK